MMTIRSTNVIGIIMRAIKIPKHPSETVRPIFCCLPLLVNGTPIFLEMFDFEPEIPDTLFQEKVLLPMIFSFNG